jgi:hypothetical protein
MKFVVLRSVLGSEKGVESSKNRRMPSSGIWYRVGLVRTDVSEEFIDSIYADCCLLLTCLAREFFPP